MTLSATCVQPGYGPASNLFLDSVSCHAPKPMKLLLVGPGPLVHLLTKLGRPLFEALELRESMVSPLRREESEASGRQGLLFRCPTETHSPSAAPGIALEPRTSSRKQRLWGCCLPCSAASQPVAPSSFRQEALRHAPYLQGPHQAQCKGRRSYCSCT